MYFTYFRKCLFVIAVLSFAILNAQTVGKIESLTNDELRFNYDVFLGAISSYENKLVVTNNTKTEEFIMLPDGSVEWINFHDSGGSPGVVHGDRYYLPRYHFNRFPRVNGVYVFDMTKTPMEQITYLDLVPYSIEEAHINRMFFSESHVMFFTFPRRIDLFCKETYTHQGSLQMPDIEYNADFFDYSNGILINIVRNNPNIRLSLYSLDESNNSIELITSRDITGYGMAWNQINVIDSKIIMATNNYSSNANAILIIDISNPAQPSTIHRISGHFSGFHYTDSHIYTYRDNASQVGLEIYELNNNGQYQQIHSQPKIHRTAVSSGYGIHFAEPYVYVQANIALLVFDSTKNYQLVNHSGYVNTIPLTSFCENDVYYMEVDLFAGEQRIYSVIDNSLLVKLNLERMSLAAEYPNWFINDNGFKIIDDRLYFISHWNGLSYIEIYQIENQEATLLSRNFIDSSLRFVPYINILGNQIFVATINPHNVHIYDLIDDQIQYKGTFSGRVQNQWSPTQSDIIINVNNRTLYIRDLHDFNRVLLSRQIDYINENTMIHYFDENHLVLRRNDEPSDGPDRARMYYFDTNNNTLELIHTFTRINLTSHNRVLVATSQNMDNNVAEFFSITDGQVVSIGSIDYYDRMVYTSETYFFPDRRKMVLWANGGIWTYDIRFEGDVSEYEEVTPIVKSELLGNFPNPFNPETTIRFNVGNAFIQSVSVHVSIDIYNIRGQRVKRLLDGFFDRGSHTVVWDGKDDSGRELGSGVYFYRMVAGDVVETRRMVLLK